MFKKTKELKAALEAELRTSAALRRTVADWEVEAYRIAKLNEEAATVIDNLKLELSRRAALAPEVILEAEAVAARWPRWSSRLVAAIDAWKQGASQTGAGSSTSTTPPRSESTTSAEAPGDAGTA